MNLNSPNNYRVLVVDDEPEVLNLVTSALEFANFEVVGVPNSTSAIELALNQQFDAGVFDVMLPDFGGFTLVERLRAKESKLPVLFLTAKDTITNKLQGFAVGGDDYLVKPFAVEELIARVNALIRRNQMNAITRVANVNDLDVITVQDLVINTSAREVKRGETIIELSPTEYSLLELIASRKGRVVSKQEIIELVWGQSFTEDYSIVDTYISFLRKKLGDNTNSTKLIETKRGIGYIIKDFD
jgi:two-component system OmpR family response regulator